MTDSKKTLLGLAHWRNDLSKFFSLIRVRQLHLVPVPVRPRGTPWQPVMAEVQSADPR